MNGIDSRVIRSLRRVTIKLEYVTDAKDSRVGHNVHAAPLWFMPSWSRLPIAI